MMQHICHRANFYLKLAFLTLQPLINYNGFMRPERTMGNRFRFWTYITAALVLLTAAGCTLPHSEPEFSGTARAETLIAEIAATEEAKAPTQTPVPTGTPVPTMPPMPTETMTPTATFGPTPTPTLGPDFFHGSLWYEPEYVSQEGLRYNGREINTGCTAASVQMVLDFWHAYKEEYPTISAQKLIDQNVRKAQFNPGTGLNIMNAEDDLRELGYYLGTRQDSIKEELLAALERYGPLLILTKVNWTPFGSNHMAVVTGYDPDKDIIRVLDPWQVGGIMEFDYNSFDGIWGLNYLDDTTETLRRTFFFIVPFDELPAYNAPFVPVYLLRQK